MIVRPIRTHRTRILARTAAGAFVAAFALLIATSPTTLAFTGNGPQPASVQLAGGPSVGQDAGTVMKKKKHHHHHHHHG